MDTHMLEGSHGFAEAIVEITTEARLRYIEEFKASMDFEDELIETSLAAFIQNFKDCKACLKRMVSKLDLRCLHLDNSDKEIGAFSSYQDLIFIFLYLLLVPLLQWSYVIKILINEKYVFHYGYLSFEAFTFL